MNLIGEHTDYNGGFVMPCAIRYETRIEAAAHDDAQIRVRSRGSTAEFDLTALPPERFGDWRDYPRGMLLELRQAGFALRGAAMDVSSTLPLGAGLSSSASFEAAFGLAALRIAQQKIEPLNLALLAQRAEMRHVGTQCGIMDQFAVLFAQAGNAIFLDTRSLQYELLPIPAGAAFVICNTMVAHELAGGEYNVRRQECERAVELLRERYPGIAQLRDVTLAQLEAARSVLPEPLFDRALHVVTENGRVVDAAAALRSSDLPRFGALMNASHESLRARYAVSCEELDLMVELARAIPGVYGARMTGGGFGGCTVTLVDAARADAFREHIAREYLKKTGIEPEIYDGSPSAGAQVRVA